MKALLTNPFTYVWVILVLSGVRATVETLIRRYEDER